MISHYPCSMSLLTTQRDYIFNTFGQYIIGASWILQDIDFLMNSGWHDYMTSLRDLDIFPSDYSKRLLVKDGKMFVRLVDDEGALSTTFKSRFFDLPGFVPLEMMNSITGNGGYDYLWPVEIAIEPNGWNDDIKPTDEEVVDLVELTRYGVLINPVELVNLDGKAKLAAFPIFSYASITNNIDFILEKIYGDDLNARYRVLQKIDNKYGPAGERLYPYIKLPQYDLPDAPEEEILIAMEIMAKLQSLTMRTASGITTPDVDLETAPGEILMALASKRLLTKMKSEGREDFLNYYAENIWEMSDTQSSVAGRGVGYMRYPHNIISLNEDSKVNWYSYQSLYSYTDKEESDTLNPSALEHPHSLSGMWVLKQEYRDKYEIKLPASGVYPRLVDLYTNRLIRVLSNVIASDVRTAEFEPGIPIRGSPRIKFESRGVVHNMPVDEYPEVYAIWKITKEVEGQYQAPRTEEFVQIQLPNTTSPYLSIHGITFRTQDLALTFFSTPVAGVIELGVDEYDPPWLSYKDVMLIKDWLSGMIMTAYYADNLSNQAFSALSESGSFLHLYYSIQGAGSAMIDEAFVLGMPFASQMYHLRLGGMDSPRTKGKLASLLSLF